MTTSDPWRRDETWVLDQELHQRETELTIINKIQQGLASHLDVQAIYDLVGEEIRQIFNAQIVMISTYDPMSHTVEHRYAIEKDQRVYYPGPHPPGGFRTEVIETRQPVYIRTNVADEAVRFNQPTLPGTQTPKSWLGVPMFVGDQVTGVLSLQNVDQENAFRPSDIRLLQTLAASMSLALENARLWDQESLYRKALERELEIGREIQAGFLPMNLPQPKGWEICASLRPAREVAGDFYDAFRLPRGKIGLIIADVCDKGLGAALFMTLIRSLLRAAVNMDTYLHQKPTSILTTEDRLKNAISLTNNYITAIHGETSMFATVFFGILEPHTGKLTYINGGHLPPLIINRFGVKTSLGRTGPAVGLMPDTVYEVTSIVIEKGDLLFSYTDGLADTVGQVGRYFGEDQLIPLLLKNQALQTLFQTVLAQVDAFAAGGKQTDDITMMAVRRLDFVV